LGLLGSEGKGGDSLGLSFGSELAISTQHADDPSAAVMFSLLFFVADLGGKEIDIEMSVPGALTLLIP
jgi:ABC-type uncharacterized transport system permease subunit